MPIRPWRVRKDLKVIHRTPNAGLAVHRTNATGNLTVGTAYQLTSGERLADGHQVTLVGKGALVFHHEQFDELT